MKIIVIGAGIGGLSSCLALQKFLEDICPTLTIRVFEWYRDPTLTTSVIGGGVGLAPNGLRSIASLSPNAAQSIQLNGFANRYMTMRNSKGSLVGRMWVGKRGQYGFPQMFASRQSVHESILKEVTPGKVEWNKKVRVVRETPQGVEVVLKDGTVEGADLIIGADGVRSVVREAVVGEAYPASYEGFTGVGGFLPFASLSPEFRESFRLDPVTMTFGPHGFFGYAPCSPISEGGDSLEGKCIMWWSTNEIDTAPGRDMNLKAMRDQLLERHGSWRSPYDSSDVNVFSSIIQLACGADSDEVSATATAKDKSILVLPTYVTPRLPRWTTPSGKIMLLGDAAHAVPPHTGQGVSLAVEDGLAIALLLRHFLTQQPTSKDKELDITQALKQAAKGYETIRMPRVWGILDRSKHVANAKRTMRWWEELFRDLAFKIFSLLPEFMFNDSVLGYNVEAEVERYIQRLPSH